jgi:hypothetical protein
MTKGLGRVLAVRIPGSVLARACTHEIANGDSDLINVRFGARFAVSRQTFPEVREVSPTEVGRNVRDVRLGLSRKRTDRRSHSFWNNPDPVQKPDDLAAFASFAML